MRLPAPLTVVWRGCHGICAATQSILVRALQSALSSRDGWSTAHWLPADDLHPVYWYPFSWTISIIRAMQWTPAHMLTPTLALIDVKIPHQWHNGLVLLVGRVRTAYNHVNMILLVCMCNLLTYRTMMCRNVSNSNSSSSSPSAKSSIPSSGPSLSFSHVLLARIK
jgi:hypothetical protein